MALMCIPQEMQDARIKMLRYVIDDDSDFPPTTMYLADGKVKWQQYEKVTEWHGEYRLQGPIVFLRFYCFQEYSRLKCMVLFRVNEAGIVYKGFDSENRRWDQRDGLRVTLTFLKHEEFISGRHGVESLEAMPDCSH